MPEKRPAHHHQVLQELAEIASKPLNAATGLPPMIYWHEDIAKLEKERIFRRDWVCAGLAADLPDVGDYTTFSVAGEPVFCIRDKQGALRTYSNVCRHRMMQLVEGHGRKGRIVCPYHAWTYDLDGRLIGAAHMKNSASFETLDICLPEIRTEVWQGWIYVTLNPDAEPVSDLLAPLESVVSRYGMEDYIPITRQDHVWQTNWKLLTENFMEGYHLPVAHKQTVGAWFPVKETRFPKQAFDAFTYQTFSKTDGANYGSAHADNTKLKGKWRHTSVMPTVFPCHMYVLAPDHLWYLSLRPKGVGEVHVRFGVALAPEVHASLNDPEAWLAEVRQFFDMVNDEDRYLVEGIYAGVQSSYAAPGPLSWLEREIHDFERYLARRLAIDAGSGVEIVAEGGDSDWAPPPTPHAQPAPIAYPMNPSPDSDQERAGPTS